MQKKTVKKVEKNAKMNEKKCRKESQRFSSWKKKERKIRRHIKLYSVIKKLPMRNNVQLLTCLGILLLLADKKPESKD